jgi:hypothetical protein
MKITKQTVKTIVSIKLDTADFFEIIETYQRSESVKRLYPDAFIHFGIFAEMTEKHILKVMEDMMVCANKDTYNYMASFNGFDGWENAGYYDEKAKTYNMVVYNDGDTLN